MADRILQLPEVVVPGKRLGRSIRHDPRSLAYLVQPTGVVQSKTWDRKVPILDQGNLGSCTGNAATGVLGTEPFFDTLPTDVARGLTENKAIELYSLATNLDDYAGAYPPDDTGSDGLSVAKACQRSNYISGYQHITSVAAAQTAILSGPFIVGSSWLSGMDNPDPSGLVHVKGSVRGGHEYECYGFDAASDTWLFCNSWGESWGDAGRFRYSSADFAKLLAQQGDATTFVPLTQPVPTPTPVPDPSFPSDDVTAWAMRVASHLWYPKRDRLAAQEFLDWRS